MDDAGEAVFTLGLSKLRFRAREAMKAFFRSHTPRPAFGGGPPYWLSRTAVSKVRSVSFKGGRVGGRVPCRRRI